MSVLCLGQTANDGISIGNSALSNNSWDIVGETCRRSSVDAKPGPPANEWKVLVKNKDQRNALLSFGLVVLAIFVALWSNWYRPDNSFMAWIWVVIATVYLYLYLLKWKGR